jgi:hypothetical protein
VALLRRRQSTQQAEARASLNSLYLLCDLGCDHAWCNFAALLLVGFLARRLLPGQRRAPRSVKWLDIDPAVPHQSKPEHSV